MDNTRLQDLVSRIGGLNMALRNACKRIAVLNPNEARREIESLRNATIYEFKNSGIPAEHEMRHAEISRPAIDAIESAFAIILRELEAD